MWFLGPNIKKMRAANDLSGLGKLLTHKDVKIREAARDALFEINGELIESRSESSSADVDAEIECLVNAFTDGDADERLEAVVELRDLGDSRTIGALMRALEDMDEAVREEAAAALRPLWNEEMARNLRVILKGAPAGTWLAALTVVRGQRHPESDTILMEAMESMNARVRVAAMEALGARPGTGGRSGHGDGTHTQVDDATVAGKFLANQDGRLADILIAALDDADLEVRVAAARGLRSANDKRAVKPLINLLATGDMEVRIAAVQALGSLQDERAVGPLIESLEERDEPLYSNTIYALRHFEGPRLIPVYVNALGHVNVKVVQDAARGLEKQKDRRALEPLVQALSSRMRSDNAVEPEDDARPPLLRALGSIGDARAVDAILPALDYMHTSEDARDALVKILETDAGSVTDAALERLAAVEDSYTQTHGSSGYREDDTWESIVDCRPLKLLTQAERRKRGTATHEATV